MQPDEIDRRLLRLLQDTPEMPVTQLADQAGLSPGPCARRLAALEGAGIITGRSIRIDARALGYGVEVFLRVTLDKTAPNAFDAFTAQAVQIPQVRIVQTLLGRVDIRMDVIARDLAHYQEIYSTQILALPHIADIEALMLVSELKNTQSLPL